VFNGYIERLSERWGGIDYPFLIHTSGSLRFDEVVQQHVDLSEVKSGDVVALIGDFNPQSILTLLQLIDKNVILVPNN
jgi:long-chain acyl-CoA synthetase